jgi:hypothetical protein
VATSLGIIHGDGCFQKAPSGVQLPTAKVPDNNTTPWHWCGWAPTKWNFFAVCEGDGNTDDINYSKDGPWIV